MARRLIAMVILVLGVAFVAPVAQADTGDIIEPQFDPPNAAKSGFQSGTCIKERRRPCSAQRKPRSGSSKRPPATPRSASRSTSSSTRPLCLETVEPIKEPIPESVDQDAAHRPAGGPHHQPRGDDRRRR